MNENPYEAPAIESDAPEHPPHIPVGGVPGLRGRYRIEWTTIALFIAAVIVAIALPLMEELLKRWFPHIF